MTQSNSTTKNETATTADATVEQGDSGRKGPTGRPGAAGERGDKGPKGPVGPVGPAGERVLPDPVHRVVIVGRQHETRAGLEREGLTHEPERTARVRREDDVVLRGVRVEEPQRQPPSLLHELGGAKGGHAL